MFTQQNPEASAVKAATDCRHVIESIIGAPVYRHSRYSQYKSPFRPEKAPSFTVYPDGWQDFGTGERGDCFDFLARHQGMTLPDAIRYLTGPALAQTFNRQSAATKAAPKPEQDSTWQPVVTKFIQDSQRVLWSPAGEKALAYLRDNRGLADETIRAAQLGYNPRWTLIPWQGTEKVAPGIVLPWFADDQLIGFEVRAFPDKGKQPKYLLYGHRGLYGNLSANKPALLTEGVFDCLLAAQTIGQALDVVTLGSAASTPNADALAGLRGAPYVLGILDNDDAGQLAAAKFADALGTKFQPVTLPDGKDVTEFVMSTGGDLRALVGAAVKQAAEVPPDIAAAMLLCGFDAALTCLRAATLGYLDDLSPAIRRRGKTQLENLVAVPVESKPEYREDSSNKRKEKESDRPLYSGFDSLPSWSQIRAALKLFLPNRLREICYPDTARGILPSPDEQMNGCTLNDEIWPDLTGDERVLGREEAKRQDKDQTRMHAKRYHAAQEFLKFAQLDGGILPRNPMNGQDYAAFLLRAVKDANPDRDFSCFEMSLITGRRAQNLESVLERAGIENQAQPIETVKLPVTDKVKVSACQAARGKGQIAGVIAIDDKGRKDRRSLNDPDLQSWADGQVKAGHELGVEIRPRAKQQVVSDPQSVKPREVKPVDSSNTKSDESMNSTPDREVSATRTPRYTGPGLSPVWVAGYRQQCEQRILKRLLESSAQELAALSARDLPHFRDLVLTVYARQNDLQEVEILALRDQLTLKDAVDLVRLQSPEIEAGQPETAPAPDIQPVRACTYPEAFTAWLDFYKPLDWSSYGERMA